MKYRRFSQAKRGLCHFLFGAFFISTFFLSLSIAQAQVYVTTGQSGAQTQIDSAPHTSTIYLNVVTTITFGGGDLTMKRGSASTANVEYTVYPTSACTGTPLAQVVHGPGAFTTQFASIPFHIPGNLTLAPGVYCTTVTSQAADQQNEAYFIKGDSGCVMLPTGQALGATCTTTLPRPRPDDCEGGSVSGARRWRPEHVRADGDEQWDGHGDDGAGAGPASDGADVRVGRRDRLGVCERQRSCDV